MINLFTDFALGTVGHTKGGPAKVAVISSGLMGTINGSGVANVVTTGQFTIPLMKRFGYTPAFAGAVEATSSMGGQIMPPVMGAVAFIMAETINVPYVEIVKAAAIPAMLYFPRPSGWCISRPAAPGCSACPRTSAPTPGCAMRERWYLLLPLAALVYLLFAGFTPLFSGTVGLALTVVLILGAAWPRASPAPPARRSSGSPRPGLLRLRQGSGSSRSSPWWRCSRCCSPACAQRAAATPAPGGERWWTARARAAGGRGLRLVGVIIGIADPDRGATTFAGFIIQIGEKSLFLSLLLTMLTCLVLGMGIPTIPNYIITSSIAAPALLELGVPLIVSHMFVFYFGIMADLTPPVALAAFAAAPIAKESRLKIGVQAVQIAIAGFVVPYMAVYAPALMLQGDKDGGGDAVRRLQGPARHRAVGRRGDRPPAHRRDRLCARGGLPRLACLAQPPYRAD
jgi:TRAP transporter 4TM/12TM fusion protein